MMLRWPACLTALFAIGLVLPAQSAEEPGFLSFSGGVFDLGKDQKAVEGRLEYRSNLKLWIFKPFVGVMGNSDGGAYGYAGGLVDVFLGRRIVTTLSFAPGYYHEGDGKNLGHNLEFRSQLEISYRLDDRSRLGLSISHMSNASIGDKNPGTESLMVTYATPVRILLGNY